MPGAVISARSSTGLLIGAFLLAALAVSAGFLLPVAFIFTIFPFIGGFYFIRALPAVLRFFVADGSGLAVQFLASHKLLSWAAVDWI